MQYKPYRNVTLNYILFFNRTSYELRKRGSQNSLIKLLGKHKVWGPLPYFTKKQYYNNKSKSAVKGQHTLAQMHKSEI